MKPYLLAAHLDVVPVDAEAWKLDPWLGKIIDHPVTGEKVVWGRGAIDDKTCVVVSKIFLFILSVNGNHFYFL